MSCPHCDTDLPSSTRFCPSCGNPGQVAVDTRAMSVPASGGRHSTQTDPYPDDPDDPDSGPMAATGRRSAVAAGETTVMTGTAPATSTAEPGPSLGERIAPAADVARDNARRWAERFGSAPLELRLAVIGALVTTISFLFLPYAEGFGQPVELSGRLWWRPIAAVAAAVLVVVALRRSTRGDGGADRARRGDALLSAVVIASAGVAEAGLLGLLAGDVVRPRAGFYGMLIGLIVVLVAAVRATRRSLR